MELFAQEKPFEERKIRQEANFSPAPYGFIPLQYPCLLPALFNGDPRYSSAPRRRCFISLGAHTHTLVQHQRLWRGLCLLQLLPRARSPIPLLFVSVVYVRARRAHNSVNLMALATSQDDWKFTVHRFAH